MVARRSAAAGTDKPGARRTRAKKVTTPNTAQQPSQERQFVDIDPWAMLLEQLMELPEEEPAQRKPESGK